MGNKKLKVVWLCYFTNQFVQDKIKPWKRVGEIAPWISSMIPLFENDNTIELHVVSQHRWISGYKSFKNKGVTYHFFNAGIPVIGRHWPGFFRFDVWTDFVVMKINFSRILKKINPDIIHVHGVENEFCTAITQFYGKYPVFITIQGFIHKSSTKTFVESKKTQNELRILKMFNHFGYRTKTMGEDIKAMNKAAFLHWHNYPKLKISPIVVDKQFDLVFFARICKEKGIEDLLQAVSMIKKEKPDISLCVIGGGKLDVWIEKAKELGISDNVYWAGFLPTQNDVYLMASTARICVLPTYNDTIPSTIIESMLLKLPVVAYDIGSIHEININSKVISLVEIFDVKGLANTISVLLNNEEMQKEIAEKGYKRILEMYSDITDNNVKTDILNAYSEVIKDFQTS
jgi:glycosyltransferase involved in cell wall biosynthesis